MSLQSFVRLGVGCRILMKGKIAFVSVLLYWLLTQNTFEARMPLTNVVGLIVIIILIVAGEMFNFDIVNTMFAVELSRSLKLPLINVLFTVIKWFH